MFPARRTRVVTTVLGLLWLASLVVWGAWGLGWMAGAVSLLNLAWAHRLYTRLDRAADAAEGATTDLELLSGLLAMLEREQFSATKLLEIQVALKRDGLTPSEAIRKLARIVEYLKQRHNVMMRPLDIFTFWSAHLVFAADTRGNRSSVRRSAAGWLRWESLRLLRHSPPMPTSIPKMCFRSLLGMAKPRFLKRRTWAILYCRRQRACATI